MPDHVPAGPDIAETAKRRHWMGVLARAKGEAIASLVAELELPAYHRIRGPETGLVMLRGRAGGDGGAFNLGEMTTTRCTIRTDQGIVGHAYVAGRDRRQAEHAALLDALLQDPAWHVAIMTAVIVPLDHAEQARIGLRARRAAATRVEFLAMATMR